LTAVIFARPVDILNVSVHVRRKMCAVHFVYRSTSTPAPENTAVLVCKTVLAKEAAEKVLTKQMCSTNGNAAFATSPEVKRQISK
jgi:hypothetical protein